MARKPAQRQTDTEEKIVTEFQRLLQEKPFKEITVSELCGRVGINRGTFYLHYIDMLDLMEKVQRDLTDQSFAILRENYHGGAPNKEMYRKYFDWICQNKEGFQILFQDGLTGTESEFSELLLDTWNHQETGLSPEVLRSLLAFVKAGTIAYIREATKDNTYTQEALDTYAEFVESAIFKVIYHRNIVQ